MSCNKLPITFYFIKIAQITTEYIISVSKKTISKKHPVDNDFADIFFSVVNFVFNVYFMKKRKLYSKTIAIII